MRQIPAHEDGRTLGAGPSRSPADTAVPVPPWLQHAWSYHDGTPGDVPTWIQHPSPSVLDPAASYDASGLQTGPDADLLGALRERHSASPFP